MVSSRGLAAQPSTGWRAFTRLSSNTNQLFVRLRRSRPQHSRRHCFGLHVRGIVAWTASSLNLLESSDRAVMTPISHIVTSLPSNRIRNPCSSQLSLAKFIWYNSEALLALMEICRREPTDLCLFLKKGFRGLGSRDAVNDLDAVR